MTVDLTTRPKCPECEHGHLVPFTRDEELDFDLGEETIKVPAQDVPVERCDTCGLVASGPAAAKVRHEAVCRAAGLLTPAEIKAIRDQFGWLQQDLADRTDFGLATISRWERGRLLPNRSNSKVLRAIRDCPPFREYLEGLLNSKAGKQEPTPSRNGAGPTQDRSKEASAINRDLVAAYLRMFWGFGNPSGRYWFVGMEQGGGNSLPELKRRLLTWDRRGRQPFEDLHEYHLEIDQHRWTGEDPELQATWKQLVRTVLVAEGQAPTEDAVLQYQAERLGRAEGETCLLELSPLPSPCLKKWQYTDWTDFSPKLKRPQIARSRWKPLQDLIDEYEPPIVLFYGHSYSRWWKAIADCEEFAAATGRRIVTATRRATFCLLLPHPTSSTPNLSDLFRDAGRLIRERATGSEVR